MHNFPQRISWIFRITMFTTLLILSLFVIWNEKEKHQEAQQNLQKHAQIISNAIWAVDIDLQKEYLNQAREFYHYRSLTVSDETGKELLRLSDSSDPSWANFYHEYNLHENIFYNEQHIGKITIIKQSHTIFTYLYLLLFLSLVHSVFYLFLRLNKNKFILEKSNKKLNQANRELTKQQSFMAAVMDNVADGIVACDENGMLSLFNRATREFHGVDQENLPPDQWADQYDLYLADGKTPMQMEEIPLYRAFKENEVKDVEMVIAQKHGNDHFVLASGKALLDESGNKLGAVVSMHDITDQKKYEALLLSSKEEAEAANRAKSIFLANMSHELRTPLNAVLGFSSMLARNPEATRDQREKLEIINRSGEHLLSMINDVLDLSKIEAGGMDLEPEAFDLPQLLQEIGNMFEMRAESRDLSFNLELDPNLARYIKADPGKIRQVLINLLGNSAKFTQEGGFALRVNTVPIENAPDVVTLLIEIEDSGPGIPPEQLEHIFEPFVQTGKSPTEVKALDWVWPLPSRIWI